MQKSAVNDRSTVTVMVDADIELRNVTYQLFVDAGHAPTAETVATPIGAPVN